MFLFHQKPDCVVILDADRKSSVILEADRSQIPIVSLVDSTTPLGSYQRITYPIPANDPIQFVYLFCHLITKTVILERGRILAGKDHLKGSIQLEECGTEERSCSIVAGGKRSMC